jgi:hypothetical protein
MNHTRTTSANHDERRIRAACEHDGDRFLLDCTNCHTFDETSMREGERN